MNEREWSKVKDAIRQMRDLDEDEGLHISTKAHDSAVRLADCLCSAGFPAPKIFSHGGDTVVFKWDEHFYLTILDSGRSAGLVSVAFKPAPPTGSGPGEGSMSER